MANMQAIVAKVMSDPKFCEILVKDPAKTLKENGVEPTPEMIEAIKSVNAQSIKKLATAFGKEKAAL